MASWSFMQRICYTFEQNCEIPPDASSLSCSISKMNGAYTYLMESSKKSVAVVRLNNIRAKCEMLRLMKRLKLGHFASAERYLSFSIMHLYKGVRATQQRSGWCCCWFISRHPYGVCMFFQSVRVFPPKVQKNALRSIGDSKMPLVMNVSVNGACAFWLTSGCIQSLTFTLQYVRGT